MTTSHEPRPLRTALLYTAAIACLAVLAVLGNQHFVIPESAGVAFWALRDASIWKIVDRFQTMVFTIGFAVAITVTLVAERLWPVDPARRTFGVSFAQDVVWFVYETVLHVLVLTTYVWWLSKVYAANFEWLTITAVQSWHPWARFAVGFLLLDFLYWLQHYCNHRSRFLWQFHAVHHSQRDLNFFSDFRYHVVEYLVRHTILTIPFLLLSVEIPTIVFLSVVLRWYTRFYHGSIRTNLGPLRYVLVTPQSHRVHHSVHRQHWDLNFGSVLSIWDRLFGTQYRGHDEYPETGIPDRDFPHEHSLHPVQLLLTPWHQMAYPFRVIARRLRAVLANSPPR